MSMDQNQIDDLGAQIALSAATQSGQDYAAKNPLGGPAKIFDAMAACIRAGDSFDAVLRQYGFAEARPAQEPVECLDCGSHNVGLPANYDSLVDSVKTQPAQKAEREALKLALEALENMCDAQSNPDRRNFPTIHDYGKAQRACIAIKAALAQPATVQPVAWPEHEFIQWGAKKYGPLMRAAINLLAEIDSNHDSKSYPHKYGVPYGAVNALRNALEARQMLEHVLAAPPTAQPAQEPEVHDALCPALVGDKCTCPRNPAMTDKAWAQFCGGIGRGKDAPYPGMIQAFEAHYGQSFIDKDWRAEAGVWAACWKAAKQHTTPSATQSAQKPVARVRFGGDEIVWLTDEPLESNTLLYTGPPATLPAQEQRQPLTRQQCLQLAVHPLMTIEQVVRVVEAAHEIGAKG